MMPARSMTLVPTDAQTRLALDAWDAEGGALPHAAAAAIGGTAAAKADDALLRSLGAALVQAWGHLPTTMRRTLYDRAVSLSMPADEAKARRSMAIFLHQGAVGLQER
jgi:hypothetical protein